MPGTKKDDIKINAFDGAVEVIADKRPTLKENIIKP